MTQADSKWEEVNLARQFENQTQIAEIQIFELGINQRFQNYFWFCITTWKTPNMKVVQLFVLYNFHVDHFSKFQMDFELGV